MKINRRNFFIRVFQAIAVISIPAVFGSFLESCKNTPIGPDASQIMPTLSGTLSGGNVTLNVDSSSPLAKTGTAALVRGEEESQGEFELRNNLLKLWNGHYRLTNEDEEIIKKIANKL